MSASVDIGGTPTSTDDDRRRCPRATVSVPFTLLDRDGRTLLKARTVDLSLHGALLHGGAVVTVDERVTLAVARGPAQNPLALEAQVVRVTPPRAGRKLHVVAVRFVDLTPLDEVLLARIIAHATV